MKRHIKAIIAAMLAAVIAFGGITAFAVTDTNSKLEWDFYGEKYYYDYAGELKEGENEIVYESSNYIYYTFDVQASGYYSMTYDYHYADFSIEIPKKLENSIAYNTISSMNYGENYISGNLFYLEKGEQIVGLDIYHAGSGTKLTIEYLGEDITSVDTAKKTLILGSDIYCYNDEIEGYIYEITSDINITFTSGKSISKYYFSGSTENEIKKGENTITLWICEKKYNLTFNAELVTDYVESVEISNIEDYLNIKIYYNGYDGYEPYGETLTVTFKDGTTDEIVLNDDEFLTLPNGSEVWCYTDFESNDNKITLNVYIADTLIKSYECIETEATVSENIDYMNTNNMNHLSDVSYYIRRALISLLECDSIYEIMEYGAEDFAYRLGWAFESFINLFREFTNLTIYLLS